MGIPPQFPGYDPGPGADVLPIIFALIVALVVAVVFVGVRAIERDDDAADREDNAPRAELTDPPDGACRLPCEARAIWEAFGGQPFCRCHCWRRRCQ